MWSGGGGCRTSLITDSVLSFQHMRFAAVLFLSGWRVQTLGLVSCSMNYLSVVTATLSAQTSFYVGVFHEKGRCISSGGTMWAGGSV